MNKIIKRLFTPLAVFAMAIGIGVSVNAQKDVVGAKAASETYTYATGDGTWITENVERQYQSDNFTFLHKKNNSSSNVATTYAELRVYASHSMEVYPTVSGKLITQIAVTTGSNKYGTAMGNATVLAGTSSGTATSITGISSVSGSVATFNLSGVENCEYVKFTLAAQSRTVSWAITYTTPSVDVVTALSVDPTSKTYFTTDKLLASDFAVTITKNGAAGTSSDYTAKIGTGTGGTFIGTDIVWGTTQPTTANTTIQFKSKYPTIAGGSTYLTADVTLTVNAPILEGIVVTTQPTKKDYYTNDNFDPTGMVVTASYNNGISQPISNSSLSFNPSPLTQGTSTVTISYTEGTVTKTATISGLTVLTKTLNSISINTATSKLSFTLGEAFVYPGLVIDAHYNGGTEEITSGFSVNGVDTMILGPQTATITFEEMTTSYAINVTNEGASVGPASTTNDLFISEWIEPASGNNKFIEIYNPLAEAVDLSTYTMKAFPNGAATASATLALTGTLAAGETIVIYNVQQVIIPTEEIPSTWISQSYPGLTDFNGDDTFGLFNNDVLIDLVGEIGVDPGTEWSGLDFLGASVQTKDSNWTRHGSITVPNATFTMAEWVVGPWDTHTLGSHTHAYNDVTVSQQATAFANYVMTGKGSDAKGECEAVLTELQAEFDFMVEDAQLEFETNPATLFVDARARMAYLEAWVAANPTANPNIQLVTSSRNNLAAVITIGALGLTTILGYYFLKKKELLG